MTLNVRKKLYKWTCYAALMLLSALLCSTVFSSFRVLSCAPSLIPFIVAAIALREGVGEGMIAGLAGGFICDAFYSSHEGFYIIALTLLAFLVCLMNTIMYWKSFGMAVLDWAVMMSLLHIIHYCVYMLARGQGSVASLLYVIPGEFLATIPFTPFLYAIVKKTGKSFEEMEE
ncbi:MAG: rod shape-determining protein MreD [Oscillospiraceae bacterium]|nr:rod shape-determining protein MreD [Oscillospiraceae bacterium]